MINKVIRERAPLFLRAARGEKTERTPVWLMRQAGRTDPEYNVFRKGHAEPLEMIFANPEKSAAVTLMPARIGVDALVVFQDILTPLTPAGAPFHFRPDPQLDTPLRTREDLRRIHPIEPEKDLAYQKELFLQVREASGGLPIIGFAGAPLTLLAFLVEGKSFSFGTEHIRALLREAPAAAHEALSILTELTIDYLRYQVACGADVVQLFESAAFLFSPDDYKAFALPCQQRIFSALRGVTPTIHFAHFPDQCPPLELLAAAGAEIISLPSGLSIADARRAAGAPIPLQGNLDNRLLATGNWEEIAAAARRCLKEGGHHGHIFNLGHGLLRETPHANVVNLVALIRSVLCRQEGDNNG